jgi:hypothetical protein
VVQQKFQNNENDENSENLGHNVDEDEQRTFTQFEAMDEQPSIHKDEDETGTPASQKQQDQNHVIQEGHCSAPTPEQLNTK